MGTEAERQDTRKAMAFDIFMILEKEPSMGCEDFSYFALERPACFFLLGCYSKAVGEYVDLHNSKFTIDEACLMTGVELQVRNVLALLENNGGK